MRGGLAVRLPRWYPGEEQPAARLTLNGSLAERWNDAARSGVRGLLCALPMAAPAAPEPMAPPALTAPEPTASRGPGERAPSPALALWAPPPAAAGLLGAQ